MVMEDTAILLTASRELAIGLAALLLSIPPLRRVERVPAPGAMLTHLATVRQPALLILDAGGLGETTPQVVESVRAVSPDTRCLVLSDSVADSRALASSGVETVIVKGANPGELVDTIETLLGEG